MSCQFCATPVTIPERGTIVFHHLHVNEWNHPFPLILSERTDDSFAYSFHSHQQLYHALESISSVRSDQQWVDILNGDQTQSISIMIQHLYERLHEPMLTDVLQQGRFSSHLQPIVHMEQEAIFGYEALLRSEDHGINPGFLFSHAHRAGLHSYLDQQARRTAVKTKSELLYQGEKIFINFLPSTIYVPEFCLRHTFDVIENYQIAPEDLVFEVVETEKIADVRHLKNIFNVYKQAESR
ncbi:EAL domain-containing protein [Thalassobacillus sp. CUG 92003]|uniref:EAL domain-containing protein n=1 Tax=Thalassobacillus sp. CUG 92003 TaxID=2736641 RepID=UPI002104966B|nr:EAL domain-containing protein [Thalassobacillus sp. CUG 92003]